MSNFIEKKSDNLYMLHLNIKPNSKNQRITANGNYLTITLRSKPIKNKANKELISLIKKKLKISSNQIEIISGLKSSTKIIKLHFLRELSEDLIISKLLN